MGRAAGRNMAGASEHYTHLPFFYSDLFELGYEAVGEIDARLETVSRWKEPFREGIVYYLRTGTVRGVLLGNVWEKVEKARALISEGRTFTLAKQRRGDSDLRARRMAPEVVTMIAIQRTYDPPSRTDGTRILVDRIWPRGVTKQEAHVEKWMRELGPSDELRQFFGHDPARWWEFRNRYMAELKQPEAKSLLAELLAIAGRGTLTLVYSAKDQEHNQAVVLKELLDRKSRQS
jgi:uncharacterized protein YeaO (DUF488 family)